MIHIDIRNHLATIQDDNQKLQFLQEIMNHVQQLANIIQAKHQAPFAEVIIDEPEEIVLPLEPVEEITKEENVTTPETNS